MHVLTHVQQTALFVLTHAAPPSRILDALSSPPARFELSNFLLTIEILFGCDGLEHIPNFGTHGSRWHWSDGFDAGLGAQSCEDSDVDDPDVDSFHCSPA